MNDSFGAGGFNATGGGGGAVQENKAEGVLPLTIRHIQESSDNGLQLFGIQYSMVTFIAIVRNIDHSSTKITYRLEDHTGQVDAHLWLEEGDTTQVPGIVMHGYARIVGSVRNQGGSKAVMIFKIDQVSSPNEITTHLLEVLNARYKGEEYAKAVAGGSGYAGAGDKGSTASSGGFMETDGNTMGLTGKQLLVYKAIKGHISDIGISRKELQQKFQHISGSEMQNITDYMTQEGIIYTSVDSDHFLCVDS
ncbi:replication protein A 32 kDa subunit [Topomyia yanbarensis]|uniref:replication protein A 32 kDa subunit n=1 Tax=Topomyia yanbarensis TaxID=2498891 RepID=UPI00273AF795|nr:replication protein A 32 kDa subunit [Topomyia yanbarensis]